MRIYNIILSIILVFLILFLLFLIPDFESIQVDPMGDGQSGIGKAMIGLMILGSGILTMLFVIISITSMFIRVNNRTKLGFINLIVSLIISVFTLGYFFG